GTYHFPALPGPTAIGRRGEDGHRRWRLRQPATRTAAGPDARGRLGRRARGSAVAFGGDDRFAGRQAEPAAGGGPTGINRTDGPLPLARVTRGVALALPGGAARRAAGGGVF